MPRQTFSPPEKPAATSESFADNLPEAIKRIAMQFIGDPLAWQMADLEIVIVFRDGRKLKLDARPDPDGRYIEITR